MELLVKTLSIKFVTVSPHRVIVVSVVVLPLSNWGSTTSTVLLRRKITVNNYFIVCSRKVSFKLDVLYAVLLPKFRLPLSQNGDSFE